MHLLKYNVYVCGKVAAQNAILLTLNKDEDDSILINKMTEQLVRCSDDSCLV